MLTWVGHRFSPQSWRLTNFSICTIFLQQSLCWKFCGQVIKIQIWYFTYTIKTLKKKVLKYLKQKCKLDLLLGSGHLLPCICFDTDMSPTAYLLHKKGERDSPIFIDKEIKSQVLGDFIKLTLLNVSGSQILNLQVQATFKKFKFFWPPNFLDPKLWDSQKNPQQYNILNPAQIPDYLTNQVKKQRSAFVLLEVSSERKAQLVSIQYMRTSKASPSGHIRTGWDRPLT